jgi:adenylate kinase family enzyme
MVKIAICGPMASGKTWLAHKLCEELGLSKISLAAQVKVVARDLFFMDPEHKDRILLQEIGKKMRDIRPSVWVDYMLNSENAQDNCVCDDVRFVNEARKLSEEGFLIIMLEIEEELQKSRLMRAYPDNWEIHWNARSDSSETELLSKEMQQYIDETLLVTDGLKLFEQMKEILELRQ